MAQPTPPPSPAPSGQPDRRALLEAYQNVVRAEQSKRDSEAQQQPYEPSGRGFWVSMSLTILGLTALLVLQPAWLFTKPPEEPAALSYASLRVRMFVEIERIERFRSDSGRLPTTLTEAGVPDDGLTFESFDGRNYTLMGVNGARTLVYSSQTPAQTFLGDSYRLIRERGRP